MPWLLVERAASPTARPQPLISTSALSRSSWLSRTIDVTSVLLRFSRTLTIPAEATDVLRRIDGALKIASRKLVLDQNVLLAKNVSIFF